VDSGKASDMIADKFKFWKKNIIQFSCMPEHEGAIPEPIPASKNLPEWFKHLNAASKDHTDDLGQNILTAKSCLPLIDGMNYGYIIRTAFDATIRSNYNNSQIQILQRNLQINTHESYQVGGSNKLKNNQFNILKFVNYWHIKTISGWSTLFLPCLNHFDAPFTALTALVDTDVYNNYINFPAVLNITDADLFIPAGTPIVTAIPIKRNTIPRIPPIKKMSDKFNKKINTTRNILESRMRHYTLELRHKK
jgi:hypothetical protein